MVEYELYQLKIPKALGDKLREQLSKIIAAHQEELRQTELEIKVVATQANADKLQARLDALATRGKKLSIHNLIRVVLANGMPAIDSPMNALLLVSKHGISTGRPRVRS